MQVQCSKCFRSIALSDIVEFSEGRLSHVDCARPRTLTMDERTLLFVYCGSCRRPMPSLWPQLSYRGTCRRSAWREPCLPVPSMSEGSHWECPHTRVRLREATHWNPAHGAGRQASGAAPGQAEPASAWQSRRPHPRSGSSAVREAACPTRSHVAEDRPEPAQADLLKGFPAPPSWVLHPRLIARRSCAPHR